VNADERRSAHLLFSEELAAGSVSPSDLDRREVRAAVRSPWSLSVPPAPVRIGQRVAMKKGRLGVEDAIVAPMMRARRAVLGADAGGPPRVLVRVDEFPHYEAVDKQDFYGTDDYRRFHEIMAGAGVAYLIAVVTRPARKPLDPEVTDSRTMDDAETAELAELVRDGVTLAVHGLDHRTRDARPRHHSELSGLSSAALRSRLDAAHGELAARGLPDPRVFVPPYNRFDADQLELLSHRYDVVCGGPESVSIVGWHRTPVWRGEGVYLPCYAPFYGRMEEVVPAVERLAAMGADLWVPITLHWGWERHGDFRELERLAARLGALSAGWEGFLSAADAARQAEAPSLVSA
jgi:hypothetical protein